ncbi:MAG: PhoH family protein [Bacteroidales bacterium]|nr:PhoH family protein [Bacteroidales bacterium]
MSEKNISIPAAKAIDIYGVNDANLQYLRKFFPKLRIIARGDFLKLMGDEEEIARFDEKFSLLEWHYDNFGKLEEKDIANIMNVPTSIQYHSENQINKDVIVYGRNGLLVQAKTVNQRFLVEKSETNDLIFAIGPAGTGKTYTAVALAVRALKNKEVRRIILTRPAVEAGENLGFLPGDLKDKLDPYLQPLYDALRDMLPQQRLQSFLDEGIIQIAPLAFMRGRTLDHAFAILDEAQNATEGQLKMFLTRMGASSKFIVTGDVTQIDLPRNQRSGLVYAEQILNGIEGIGFVQLNEKDIVRHRLVGQILGAYERDHQRKQEKLKEINSSCD